MSKTVHKTWNRRELLEEQTMLKQIVSFVLFYLFISTEYFLILDISKQIG